ncbi:MAG: hypothetical protein Q8R67_11930 [Rhodoferax sp.]|nr:DUF6622 family protein [Rhodoferax sp.]MDP3652381.1 hypothetical protein [Rhodoferax sp.]
MLMQILTHTPKWIFVLFVALLWLGLLQMRPRSAGLNRITIVPLVMTGLSLYSVTSVFGDTPQALLAWMVGAMVASTTSYQMLGDSNIRYHAASRRFLLPGSVVPLALIMGIFFTKYVVGVFTKMQPSLVLDSNFALSVSTVYGCFSGIFLARAAKLWRIALVQTNGNAQSGALA